MNNKITNIMIEETDTPTQYEVYKDAPVQEQIKELFEITDSLKTEVKTLSDKVTKLEGREIEPEPPSTEYPEYKQPAGSHDAYYNGDKVTFKGKNTSVPLRKITQWFGIRKNTRHIGNW